MLTSSSHLPNRAWLKTSSLTTTSHMTREYPNTLLDMANYVVAAVLQRVGATNIY